MTKEMAAMPMSVWQFYDKVGEKIEALKRTYITADNYKGGMPNTIIKVEGQNENVFSNEVFIINISSNNNPVVVDWNLYQKDVSR